MSSIDPFVPGGSVLSYRLLERVSAAVWRAEDERGRQVAVKVLSRQLPRDPARRDALVRDVRQGAALFHTALVTIMDIVVAGDALLLVMEWFDGQPLGAAFRGRPAETQEFFRIAYQLADAVKLLHAKNVLHLNIAGDSVLIGANNQVKLAGLNGPTFLPRRDGQSSAFAQKGNDPNAVSYMAPEQIANQPVGKATDVFALGSVMYELATGRRPYLAASAAEIARKIVDEQPPSPKAIHAGIETPVLNVIGKCFFKDPSRRYPDAKAVVDAITRSDATVMQWANEIARAPLAAVAKPDADGRESILLVADIAGHAELDRLDPAAASKDTARMQQLLGEAVYLFDGTIVDPFAPRFVGELPSVENALEAARKAEFDVSPEQAGDALPVRLLLHAGRVETREGAVTGAAVEKAFEVLQQIEPQKLVITESFAKQARGKVRLRDAGARAGVKLFAIAPDTEAMEEAARAKAAAEESARIAAEAEAERISALAARKRKRVRLAAAAAVVLIGGGSSLLWMQMRHRDVAPAPVAAKPAGLPPATAATPRKVVVEPFRVDAGDATLQQRAEAIRLASLEVLRAFPELRVVDAPAPDVSAFTARLTGGTPAPQLVPETAGRAAAAGQAAALVDASAGVNAVVSWVAAQLKLPPRAPSTPATYNALADAVAARAANDDAATERAIRAAIKADPSFLPAEVMAFRWFDAKGRDADALAAAKQIMAVDPANADAARRVARASLASGDLAAAFQGYGAVLKSDHSNAEALNVIGRYALAAGDDVRFSAAVGRLANSDAAAVHAPDSLVAAGRIDNAVDRYYDLEQRLPSNAQLSLKIGHVAVLRHSTEIAEAELAKVEKADPDYGAHILRAYLAAQKGDKAAAASELKAAGAHLKPGGDYWTSVAEIAAMNGDARGVDDALERAVAQKEPTAAYVLANPLFRFMTSDARFQRVREKFAAQQNEIRSALAAVTL